MKFNTELNLDRLQDRICEELCYKNGKCIFKGNCIECMHEIGKLLIKDNPVKEK